MMHSMEERAAEFKPAMNALEQHSDIQDVKINVGMPMEFDPRKGETPKPDGLEFTIPEKSNDIIAAISQVCDQYGLKVIMPDFKQPNFEYKNHRGETRQIRTDVGYEAFVRLVPDE